MHTVFFNHGHEGYLDNSGTGMLSGDSAVKEPLIE